MTGELKPVKCGCGGEANIYTYEARWKKTEDGYQRSVGCLKCGIATQLYDTEAEAVTAWNRAMGADQFREVTKKIERTAKVMNDGINYCENCEGYVEAPMAYCPYCGCRLEWK